MKKDAEIHADIALGEILMENKAKFRDCLSKAKEGDVESQEDLAMMYFTGQGTERNFNEAKIWALIAKKSGAKNLNKRLRDTLTVAPCQFAEQKAEQRFMEIEKRKNDAQNSNQN